MTGRSGLGAEVVRRRDDAFAKMVEPDTINHDPRGKWVIAIADGVGEFEASAPIGEGFADSAIDDLQIAAGDDVALVFRLAADKNAGVARIVLVLDNHGANGCSGMIDIHGLKRCLEFKLLLGHGFLVLALAVLLVVLELGLEGGAFLPVVLGQNLVGGTTNDGKLLGFHAAREDTVERIVVALRDGIEHVIVAAGATDR